MDRVASPQVGVVDDEQGGPIGALRRPDLFPTPTRARRSPEPIRSDGVSDRHIKSGDFEFLPLPDVLCIADAWTSLASGASGASLGP
jgi:hypothetical protein